MDMRLVWTYARIIIHKKSISDDGDGTVMIMKVVMMRTINDDGDDDVVQIIEQH